ncbi:MAG: hypothetical protein ABJA60_03090 [Nitrosospira sp.]
MTHYSGDVESVRSQEMRQGLRSPINRGKNFPHMIAVAIVAITTGKAFPDIPRSARAVLAFALRIADRRDPTKASWAFKRTMACEIMVSESTVYRSLNILVKLGFIERFNQERKTHNGKLAVARIALTRKTCIGLGLIIRNEELKNESKSAHECFVLNRPPSVKMQDRHSSILLSADQQTQSLKKHSPIQISTNQILRKQRFFKLPGELSWLNDANLLTLPQIFLLMREFSNRKQRLSEVLVVVGSRIRALPKKEVFSYLRALAKAPTDFKTLSHQYENEYKKEKKKRDLKELILEITKGMTGCYLQSDNNAVYLLEGNTARAWWVDRGRIREGSCPVNERFAKDYKIGCLKVINEKFAKDQIATWLKSNQRIDIVRTNQSSYHRVTTGHTVRLGELLRSALAKNKVEV